MDEDRTLFGDGRYPDSGPLAILARLGFLGAALAIVVAVFMPAEMVPDFVHSPHLQHFAAFYVAALFGMAAMPRTRLRTIGIGYVAFATVLEASHLLSGADLQRLIDNWVADLGGLTAAVAPVVVERFRRRFPRPR
jgi:O-antigen ligase